MLASDISEVIRLLDAILADPSLPAQHKLFVAMYRQVTEAVADGIVRGDFDDGPRMDRFDTAFANRYLHALAQYRQGKPLSGAWSVAFQFGESGDGIVLQHLLLGMNAHINLDLAIAAAEVAPTGALGLLRDDFERINDLLASMIDGVQAALGAYSPLLDTLDRVGGSADEAVIEFSITRARAAAWRAAELLASQTADQRAHTVSLVDQSVKLLGRSIARPGPLVAAAVQLISLTESDDVDAIVDRIRSLRPGR
ncbi:MAG: hypothetical protein CL927_16305 [Deltaproteobacteria bacterium]|nr:hypothetical protein [Deltaproteobacteria bacterium]HCH63956.1 hypothetical protein [Deltaproteobacteria bacterium]